MRKSVLVVGLPRSGTSLVMSMLSAGGYKTFGSYPGYEPCSPEKIPSNKFYGQAVKVIEPYRFSLPKDIPWYIIRLNRDVKQQAKSHIKFLRTVGVPIHIKNDKALRKSLKEDHKRLVSWCKKYPTLDLNFEDIIADPHKTAGTIRGFLAARLNRQAMADMVVKRSPNNYPGLLELELMAEMQKNAGSSDLIRS